MTAAGHRRILDPIAAGDVDGEMHALTDHLRRAENPRPTMAEVVEALEAMPRGGLA